MSQKFNRKDFLNLSGLGLVSLVGRQLTLPLIFTLASREE